MATKKKMLMSAAGSAGGGGGLDIDDVFSTYLYTGNGGSQTITNGIDLDGEGGMVWTKNRDNAFNNFLYDTERGATNYLISDLTIDQQTVSNSLTSFNSNGFTLGAGDYGNITSGAKAASWTFRKAPKFFTCLTYTGNGVAGRTISHDLNTTVGMLVVKRTDSSASWVVYHKGLNGGTNPEQYYTLLDSTAAEDQATTVWNDTAPTSSEFTVGTSAAVNNHNNATYVAYLFAHNDSGDGEFGPDGDQDIIKCGSYTGNGSSTGPVIDLGFEPQWVMVKGATSTSGWTIVDNMRGMTTNGADPILYANFSNSEDTSGRFTPKPDGFQVRSTSSYVNTSGQTYIYMAIRRGPLAVPEDATKVFAMDTLGATTPNPPSYNAGFPVDLGIMKSKTSGTDFWRVGARLTGEKRLSTDSTDAEATDTAHKFDYQDGWYDAGSYVDSQYQSYMWKRAPGHFDVTAWDVDGTGYQYVNHNLGVVPEMIWTKNRDSTSPTYNYWVVGHKDLTGWDSSNENDRHMLKLNTSAASAQQGYHREFTDTSIRLLGAAVGGYATTDSVIGYLFASCPGVSEISSYTGNGSSQTINCGFTAGSRFILIKRTDSTGDWYVWDSVRGIVSANSPHLSLNTTAAEVTSDDSIDPASSGFIVNQVGATNINVSSADYIFYAIA